MSVYLSIDRLDPPSDTLSCTLSYILSTVLYHSYSCTLPLIYVPLPLIYVNPPLIHVPLFSPIPGGPSLWSVPHYRSAAVLVLITTTPPPPPPPPHHQPTATSSIVYVYPYHDMIGRPSTINHDKHCPSDLWSCGYSIR